MSKYKIDEKSIMKLSEKEFREFVVFVLNQILDDNVEDIQNDLKRFKKYTDLERMR